MASTIKNTSQPAQKKHRAVTSSTLLIPRKLLNYFNSRVDFFGSRKLYFRHLIITYGRHLLRFGVQPDLGKWKKEYQKKGLELKARHFTPEPEFWEEFRHISFAYGFGMCKLFVVLLELEQKRWKEAKCPENFFEKPPLPRKSGTNSMNSGLNLALGGEISLENLLKNKKCTVLIRSIDFLAMKLERRMVVYQE